MNFDFSVYLGNGISDPVQVAQYPCEGLRPGRSPVSSGPFLRGKEARPNMACCPWPTASPRTLRGPAAACLGSSLPTPPSPSSTPQTCRGPAHAQAPAPPSQSSLNPKPPVSGLDSGAGQLQISTWFTRHSLPAFPAECPVPAQASAPPTIS